MKQPELYFYYRNRCMLCDEAKEMMQDLNLYELYTIHEIDIEESDELVEKYGLMIPVLEFDGKIIQYGKFVKNMLKMHLHG